MLLLHQAASRRGPDLVVCVCVLVCVCDLSIHPAVSPLLLPTESAGDLSYTRSRGL
jgi:hypothetical protein